MEKILELLGSNPEMLVPVVKEYISKYKPIVYGLLQEVVEVYRDYSNNTEYPAIVAKTPPTPPAASASDGLTEDPALALRINDNIQLLKTIKQTSNSVNKSKTK